jgi:hypothetical protein
MKILFDQGTPAPLRHVLKAHAVRTAYEMGWGELNNGDLLTATESEFDAFITTDKSLRYQQRLGGRRLAVLILPTTSWPELRLHQSEIAAAIDALCPGDFVEMQFN